MCRLSCSGSLAWSAAGQKRLDGLANTLERTAPTLFRIRERGLHEGLCFFAGDVRGNGRLIGSGDRVDDDRSVSGERFVPSTLDLGGGADLDAFQADEVRVRSKVHVRDLSLIHISEPTRQAE